MGDARVKRRKLDDKEDLHQQNKVAGNPTLGILDSKLDPTPAKWSNATERKSEQTRGKGSPWEDPVTFAMRDAFVARDGLFFLAVLS